MGLARLPAPAAAQFGFKGGMNLTKFVGDDAADDAEAEAGLKLGASLQFLRLGPLAIGPEVYYAQRNGQQKPSTSGTPGVPSLADFSMDYIEVPLLATLAFPIPGARMLRPYVQGGPVYAWQLNCEVSLQNLSGQDGPDQKCEETQFQNARTAMKSADKGIIFGGGLGISVGSVGSVNLDARFIRGLDRLTEDASGADIKNQAFSLMLGYSFSPLGAVGGGMSGMRRSRLGGLF
jgi:hypothetical protein